MKSDSYDKDSARWDSSSQNLSPLYQSLAGPVYPLADEPFGEDAKTVDFSSLVAEVENSTRMSSLYQQCLEPTFPVSDELLLNETHTVSIREAFPEEEDDVLESLRASIPQAKGKDERIENIKNVISDKAVGLAEIKHLLTKQFKFRVINGTCYVRDRCTWYEVEESQLLRLIDRLSPELFDGLPSNAGRDLYQKLVNTTSLRVNRHDLEIHPNLIPCIDGVYDAETGRCYDSVPDADFFYRVNVRIGEIGKGTGHIYHSFLEKSFDDAEDAMHCYEQCQGTILSGYSPRKIFAYVGPPGSGKSVSCNLLIEYLKDHTDYGLELSFIKSLDSPNRLSKNFGLADLADKQLCLCGDMAKVGLSNETCAILKQLSGGDIIRGERKFKDPFEFVNKAKILLLSNNPLRGAIDDALRDRLVIVPFSHSVPESDRILHFQDKLYEERGYIFYRYMQALRDLIETDFEYEYVNGSDRWVSGALTAPDASIQAFVLQQCILAPQESAPVSTLHRAYMSFCDIAQYDPVSDAALFARQLRAAYPELKPLRNKSFRSYQGIALRDDLRLGGDPSL